MHLLLAALLVRHWLVAGDLHVEPARGAPTASSYGADTNWALFDSTVAAMRAADPNPQVVIVPGDFLAHHFPANVALAERTMARIARTFNAAFPHAQFVIVPGNNDDPCGDYRATPGTPYFSYLARLWAPLVNRHGAAPQFERLFARYGWYSARLPSGGERLVALDSVYWSIVYRPCGSIDARAPQRELSWFEHRISSMRPAVHAVVVMHIPPGVDASSTLLTHRLLVVPYWQAYASRAFIRILTRYASRASFVLAGHMHRDDFRSFGGVPMLIAPSVSPVYDNNPSFLELDVAAGGVLRDYTPFEYDESTGTWQRAASFDRAYGVSAFSASALASIHARLAHEPRLRGRWARYFMSGSGNREITSGTWRAYWCAQTQIGAAYVACAGLRKRMEILPIAAGLAGAALLALLAWLLLRLGRSRRTL